MHHGAEGSDVQAFVDVLLCSIRVKVVTARAHPWHNTEARATEEGAVVRPPLPHIPSISCEGHHALHGDHHGNRYERNMAKPAHYPSAACCLDDVSF